MNPVLQLLPVNIPLALYIHIPWCVKKCPYCDFNSHGLPDPQNAQTVPFASYVDALLKDAAWQSQFSYQRQISSVFIGGGTPSLLPTNELKRLFLGLKQILNFADDCEITLEANPGTLEHAPFEQYLDIGVNRLSIGVQSFDDDALTVLGRVHNHEQAKKAIQNAKKAGFRRINADLMHGLPMQTPQKAVYDLQTAIESGATHISWYQLTIEPNTAFYRKPPHLPNEDVLEQIEQQGYDLLNAHNFYNYEVSAWSGENDQPCRHNMNYWQFGDYLAIGAGAHGKVTVHQDNHLNDGIYRFHKTRLPKDYLNFAENLYPKTAAFERIEDANLPAEFMMNALRLRHGVSTQIFEERTGLLVSTIDNELLPLQHEGFMVHDPTLLSPTKMGFRYVNHLVRSFL